MNLLRRPAEHLRNFEDGNQARLSGSDRLAGIGNVAGPGVYKAVPQFRGFDEGGPSGAPLRDWNVFRPPMKKSYFLFE